MRALLLVALISAAIPGQQPPVVFRSGTDVVRFDVRVTGPDGRPLKDLRPDEIEIVEDGAPRPILLFQHFDEPAGGYADAAMRAVSAEVSSNREAPRGHLYLMVFDQRHILPGNEQVARRAAETFIKTFVRPSDRVAVIGIPGPGPRIGFTADRTRAIAELGKVQGSAERTVQSPVGRMTLPEAYEAAAGNDAVIFSILSRQSADVTADAGASPAGMNGIQIDRAAARAQEEPATLRKEIVENSRVIVNQADGDARDSLQRLADVIEQYRSIEGRKTVLFFSEGFQQRNVTRDLERVAAAAAASYSVFYTFDLNRRGNLVDQATVSTTSEGSDIQARLEPLGNLALETDGLLVQDAASHLDAALARVAEQTQDYYLVGFAPSAGGASSPGTYRRVSVRVKRPGVRVSARTGYAVPRGGAPARRDAIDAALAAPFAHQGLRLEYSTYAMRSDNAGRARVILSLEADLPLRDGPNGTADVVFVVRDMRDGRVVASGTDTMPLPATPEAGARTGIGRYRVHFDVPPGSYLMRTVVREPGGLLGSADRKLDVRPFSGPDVSVSDVILASASGPLAVRARAFTEDGVSGFLDAYARTREQLADLSVTATLVSASGATGTTVRADLADTMSDGSGMMRRAWFALPLADAGPGPYVARIKVASGTEVIAEVTRELDVVAGSAPAAAPPVIPEPQPRDVLDSDLVKALRAQLRASTQPAATEAARGLDSFARADYATAATELSAAFAADPANAPLAFVLGWAYEATGDHRHAIGSWRAAVTIDPRLLPAHLALVEGYLRMSETALAMQAVRAALTALPDSPELQVKLAQIQRS